MNGMHGIIFSYEKKTALRELIENRIHGSIPFAGDYRVVDFMLSNMVNAGITDVGVIMHGNSQSLLDHLGSGKSWDLSRNRGGLKLLPAFAFNENRMGIENNFIGKVEALWCVKDYLKHIRHDYVVVADSDLVINLPLDKVLEDHIASGADMTCVCASHPGEQEDTHFKLDTSGNIIDTTYELPNPTDYRSLNVFVLKTDLLLSMVEECQAHNAVSWRHDILQEMGKRYRFRAFVWDGYAAKIDSVQSYFEKSMELLRPEIRAELFDPRRPIHAKLSDSASTFIDPDSRCVNSLIADGCDIRGSVKNCILFRGVTVEKGANVENCILFKDTTVHSGAILKNVIADKNVVISENATLMGHEKYPVVIAKNSEV